MKEIKSVRVRKRYTNTGVLDIKVTIYEDNHTFGADERVLVGTNNGNPIWISTRYKKSGIYKEFSDKEFIDNFILTNSKSSGGGSTYDIIQDPWDNKVPLWRSYGFDPYYLNNGAQIIIPWRNGTSVEGGKKYSDSDGKELDDSEKGYFTKTIDILYSGEKKMTLNKSGVFEYGWNSQEYTGIISDIDIVKTVIAKWNIAIPNYGLELCKPNNESCLVIPYKSPLEPLEVEKVVDKVAINETPKEKVTVTLETGVVKVKIDTSFKIYIGDPKETKTNTVEDELIGLDDEYTESNFDGLDEVEFDIQEQVANSQEDSDTNLGSVGEPVKIKPVHGLDELLKLAGDCARELGKNARVNYKNLSSGYIKGIHGLCPQGTLSVLYAITGVKSIAQKNGNANTFAFNGNQTFTSTGYFNNKIKVDKNYFDSPSTWQIGDIIANDYIDKKYGHIQIWTGVKWVSDFTQKQLQVSHINWDTVALHRLNEKGLALVKQQNVGAVV